MRFGRLFLGVSFLATLGSCSRSTDVNADTPSNEASRSPTKPTVVASFYPLAFIAERLVGDVATIVNLTPPGVEPHDLELSPDQMGMVEDARLVLTMGQGLQPSVEDAAKRRDTGVVALLDLLAISTPATNKRAEENFDPGSDPHVWLDPQLMQNSVAEIATALATVFPDSLEDINIRSTELGAELRALDASYVSGLAGCKGRILVTSHAAFGRLAYRFGMTQQAIVGLSPDAEPTADRLAKLADLVKENGVTTIFTEELVSPKIANTLARETGIKVTLLSPLESAPERGDYVAAMTKNLKVLRSGLNC
jgi:zinc transport system substrate-binding protein